MFVFVVVVGVFVVFSRVLVDSLCEGLGVLEIFFGVDFGLSVGIGIELVVFVFGVGLVDFC